MDNPECRKKPSFLKSQQLLAPLRLPPTTCLSVQDGHSSSLLSAQPPPASAALSDHHTNFYPPLCSDPLENLKIFVMLCLPVFSLWWCTIWTWSQHPALCVHAWAWVGPHGSRDPIHLSPSVMLSASIRAARAVSGSWQLPGAHSGHTAPVLSTHISAENIRGSSHFKIK